jgi:acetyltransferase-like isoleucine patch superfamily enzyme
MFSRWREQAQRHREAGFTSGEHWASSLQLATKVGPMAARGLVVKPLLRTSGGLLLMGRGARIRNPQFLGFQGSLVLEDFVEIQALSEEGIEFGRDVVIGAYSMFRPSGYYSRRIGTGMQIGDRTGIGPCCYFGCSGRISIGSDVMIGPAVRIFGEDHAFGELSTTIKSQGVVWRPVIVEDDVWIGSGATITSGVTIGRGAVIGAGSVVTRDVLAGTVVGGNPARQIRARAHVEVQ